MEINIFHFLFAIGGGLIVGLVFGVGFGWLARDLQVISEFDQDNFGHEESVCRR